MVFLTSPGVKLSMAVIFANLDAKFLEFSSALSSSTSKSLTLGDRQNVLLERSGVKAPS